MGKTSHCEALQRRGNLPGSVIVSGAQPVSEANALAVAKQSLHRRMWLRRLLRRCAPRNDVPVPSLRAQRSNPPVPSKQSGYLLLPVAVAIALIGVIAFLISSESAIEVDMTAGELEAARAEYVAQAGLQHALREHAQQGCGPYTDMTNVSLGSDKYGTSLTTDLGTTSAYTINVDQDTWIRSDQPTVNNASDIKLHTRNEAAGVERPLLRYDLSPLAVKASILSATAWFYVTNAHAAGPIDIHLTISDWTETDATWDSMNANMDPEVLATIPSQPTTGLWVPVNLTTQVQAWINGQPNFGITLNSTVDGVHGQYNSRESANAPYLEVIVGTPPSSPAILKSVGTLANDVSRTIYRKDVVLYQHPPGMVRLQPDAVDSEDAEIWDQAPNNNYGDAAETWVSSATNDTTRSLLRFNMGAIPAGARILGATLSLERQSGSGADQPVSAHRIRNSWREDSVTWNSRETGTSWDTAGGDFDNTAVATTPVGPVNQRYAWNITPLVQGWVDGSYVNHGVLLVAGIAGMPGERFYTSDHADPSRWPSLSITYTCACGVVCGPPQGSGRIVMIGNWSGSDPDARDQEKEDVIESWGYEVDQADDDSIWAINFGNYDLVYVSETASSAAVTGQLNWRSIGIVNEQGNLNDDLGFATVNTTTAGDSLDITDNDHYITTPFALGSLPIYDAQMEIIHANGSKAPGMQTLGEVGGTESLMTLDTGAITLNGPAPGKRVALPLGRATNSNFNWTYLNNNGRLLVQRSIEWAMGGGSLPTIGNLLLVVDNDGSLTSQELAKQALFESWGYAVNVIDSGDSQTQFATAAAANDVVYIGEDINSGDLGTKLVDVSTGVVLEEANLSDEFGFSDGINWGSGTALKMERNHYITYTLPATASTILTATESLANLTGNQAPDIQLIGFNGIGPSLAALDTGASVIQGRTAAGRRVFVPWGGNDMDINHLNDDGRTILQRSIEWAAGANLDLGPLAHWKLDETGGTTAVDSRGGHDGTLANGPVWGAGMLDGGLAFDGIDDAIVVPHDDTLSLTEAMTFTAWVKSDAFGVSGLYDLVVSKGTVATSYAYYFGTLDDEIIFGFSDGGTYREFTTSDLNLETDTWHHLAATFDNATNRVRLYHNGAEVLSASTTYEPSATTHDLYIGSSEDGADWDGLLDDVRIYDRVLGADEVATLAERPGPLAHWKFDEGSGNTAVDSVGGHDATIASPIWDPGQDGDAIRVQALDQAGAAPHDATLNLTRGLTLMAWVNKASLSGYDTAIDKASSGSDINYFLGTWYDEIVFGFSTTSDNWQGFYTSGVNLSTGSWDHIVATFDNPADEVSIYHNGGLVQTFSTTLEPLTNSGNLWLGRSALVNELLSGRLDDARIYDRVLDGQEIADVYDEFGGGSGGGASYTETNQTWSATDNGIWQTVDLSSFGVPPNAVVEVVVENTQTGGEREGGVRAVGSTVGRHYDLQEAEGGGVDTVTLHVQADASSQIQHYAENDSSIRFRMIGYWTGGSYSDRDVLFTAGGNNSWRTRSLSAYGVAPGQIVEIIAQNNNGSNEYLAGVRASGSSNTQTFDLHEAQAGGRDFLSIFVEASGDASASVEVFAENDGEIEFKVVGVWDTPPGTYTEARAVLGNPTTDSSWQTVDLSGFGVPPNSVVQIVMANRFASAQNRQGLRSVDSSMARYIDIHEAEDGGEDLATIHVPVDGSSQIQWFHQDVSEAHNFYLVGWWVLSP